ncbi:MAG: FHA domain-containing protein [Chthonomonas sp.]|nr:FHA domain-containing protein [Chthonomonas sp.]
MEPEDVVTPMAEDAIPLARLIVIRGGIETTESFLFAPPATIGRFDPSVGPIDVDLGGTPEGAYVSRRHAKIDFENGNWSITDLESSNGTYVRRDDFEKVETAEIKDGDEIALGNARFAFRVGAAPDAPVEDQAPVADEVEVVAEP